TSSDFWRWDRRRARATWPGAGCTRGRAPPAAHARGASSADGRGRGGGGAARSRLHERAGCPCGTRVRGRLRRRPLQMRRRHAGATRPGAGCTRGWAVPAARARGRLRRRTPRSIHTEGRSARAWIGFVPFFFSCGFVVLRSGLVGGFDEHIQIHIGRQIFVNFSVVPVKCVLLTVSMNFTLSVNFVNFSVVPLKCVLAKCFVRCILVRCIFLFL
ncbi:unnamed protein product, partial [Urochloa humidicola]